MNNIKFGANYVPSNGWFYSWVDFEKEKIEEDFLAMKEMGMDHLRVHLRWDLFQPAETYVPESMLKKLGIMLDVAEKVGLQLVVSVFTGWMSGLWFLPTYVRKITETTNIITDKTMINGEKYLLKRIADAVGSHPALGGIDLGNELNVFHTFIDKFSLEEGDVWLRDLTEYCKALFPGKIVVLGVDHQPWFEDVQFTRSCMAETGNLTSLHTWTKFTGGIDYGMDSQENLSLIEYNIELANAYAKQPDRKVWIQEFGVVSEWMPDEYFGTFLKTSMKNACRSENLWGFTIWCSHEYDNCYAAVDNYETRLGILTKDNKLKPLGQAYKEAIDEIKRGEIAAPLKTGRAIIIDENKPFRGWEYGEAFADYVKRGEHVKFVLSSRADDKEMLKKRGIEVCQTL